MTKSSSKSRNVVRALRLSDAGIEESPWVAVGFSAGARKATEKSAEQDGDEGVTTMAGSGDLSPIFEREISSHRRCSGSEARLLVIYTYLRAQEPGCSQGDAWEACGDEYLLGKNVEGPQNCRDISTLRTVGGHGCKLEESEGNFEVANEVYKADIMAEAGYIEEPRSKQASETSVLQRSVIEKSMDWENERKACRKRRHVKWEVVVGERVKWVNHRRRTTDLYLVTERPGSQ